MVTFSEAFTSFWKNYANFNGRTPRSGYWFWQLWTVVISVGFVALALIPFVQIVVALLSIAFGLATIIPTLALNVRRLHDTGRRWYWILIPFLPWMALAVFILIALVQMSSMAGYPGSYFSPYSSYDSMLATIIATWGVFVIIYLLLQAACGIFWLVLMCLPTTEDAIGESTFEEDNYYQPYSGSKAALPMSGLAGIKGVDGMYRDVTFPLEIDEEIVVGRDAALSHIVFDRNAEKVSRKHCSISYDAHQNAYRVIDYSTNGTFKDDGTRLTSNTVIYLPAGTLLCLGNRTNSIRLV